MTIPEFVENYYLHDSSIERVEYDAAIKTASIVIGFCQWMQEWYTEGMAENLLIALHFHGVSELRYDPDKGNSEFGNTIHSTEIADDGSLIFKQTDDDTFEYYETIVKAESVEVEELECYNF